MYYNYVGKELSLSYAVVNWATYAAPYCSVFVALTLQINLYLVLLIPPLLLYYTTEYLPPLSFHAVLSKDTLEHKQDLR
jgi:hypothetical protein